VVWQVRTKPDWDEKHKWTKWEDCRKESYEDYIRVPLLHDWTYETRELYTSPKRESKSDDESYYQHIKEHKQQCEDDFINQQSEEQWYANSLGEDDE